METNSQAPLMPPSPPQTTLVSPEGKPKRQLNKVLLTLFLIFVLFDIGIGAYLLLGKKSDNGNFIKQLTDLASKSQGTDKDTAIQTGIEQGKVIVDTNHIEKLFPQSIGVLPIMNIEEFSQITDFKIKESTETHTRSDNNDYILYSAKYIGQKGKSGKYPDISLWVIVYKDKFTYKKGVQIGEDEDDLAKLSTRDVNERNIQGLKTKYIAYTKDYHPFGVGGKISIFYPDQLTIITSKVLEMEDADQAFAALKDYVAFLNGNRIESSSPEEIFTLEKYKEFYQMVGKKRFVAQLLQPTYIPTGYTLEAEGYDLADTTYSSYRRVYNCKAGKFHIVQYQLNSFNLANEPLNQFIEKRIVSFEEDTEGFNEYEIASKKQYRMKTERLTIGSFPAIAIFEYNILSDQNTRLNNHLYFYSKDSEVEIILYDGCTIENEKQELIKIAESMK